MVEPDTIDWPGLSPRGRAILNLVAVPVATGYSHREVGDLLGQSEAWVTARMKELRAELRELGAQSRCVGCRAEIVSGQWCEPCQQARRAAREREKAAAV